LEVQRFPRLRAVWHAGITLGAVVAMLLTALASAHR